MYGKGVGSALLRFHTPVSDDLRDPRPFYLRADVKVHQSYKVRLGGPNIFVIAPDKDLNSYKTKLKIKTTPNMNPYGLFSLILNKVAQTKEKKIRNLVLQCHGDHGRMWIFGKDARYSDRKYLNNENVHLFRRLEGKVEAIWTLSCTACGDPTYSKSIAMNARAYVIGANGSNPQKPYKFKDDEIEYHIQGHSVVRDRESFGLINIAEFIGMHSNPYFEREGKPALLEMVPA